MLTVDPKKDGFSGVVDIAVTLDQAAQRRLAPRQGASTSRAPRPRRTAARELAGDVEAAGRHRDGRAHARRSRCPRGKATLHLEYDAPFGPKLEGLYKVTQAGVPYAFTQFESIAARDAFPCFDEPGFKIPFDTTLVVPADAQARRQHARDRPQDGGRLAPRPLRADAPPAELPRRLRRRPARRRRRARRPAERASASARSRSAASPPRGTARRSPTRSRTPARSSPTLEKYFGIEYPYDKLDILAVPDKGGAMENAGAVTFGDDLLLFDEKTAPLRQQARLRGRDGARARAPVDRRSRHGRVVGRHLAERGLRHLDREQDRRRLGPEAGRRDGAPRRRAGGHRRATRS